MLTTTPFFAFVQIIYFLDCRDYVKNLYTKRPEKVEPLHIFLTGKGGCGKSHLIRAIYHSITKMLGYHDKDMEKPRVMLLAPTGVAAINIGGTLLFILIAAIDEMPHNISQSDISKALNRKQSETGGIARILRLKVEARVMLICNIDIEDRLISGQIGTVRHINYCK